MAFVRHVRDYLFGLVGAVADSHRGVDLMAGTRIAQRLWTVQGSSIVPSRHHFRGAGLLCVLGRNLRGLVLLNPADATRLLGCPHVSYTWDHPVPPDGALSQSPSMV